MPEIQSSLFSTYAIAAALMILYAVSLSWLTVFRMMKEKGGYRAPEDLRKTLLNPAPDVGQIAPNDRVERVRRIQLNNSENLPYFLVAGFLFILTSPALWLAQFVLFGYVVSRVLHFYAYITARNHEIRAFFWTIGSVIIIYMAFRALFVALNFALV
jgi:glutathione S-transferase